jgi:hypothetical protein
VVTKMRWLGAKQSQVAPKLNCVSMIDRNNHVPVIDKSLFLVQDGSYLESLGGL